MSSSYSNLLKEEILQMSLKQHLIYWLAPILVLGTLLIFYFSGNYTLQQIVCPSENWEWGVLENLQNIILVLIIVLCLRNTFSSRETLIRAGFFAISLSGTFVLLEELDYGAHILHYFTGEEKSLLKEVAGVKNLHNINGNAKYYKRPIYPIMLILFVIAPVIGKKIKNLPFPYLFPEPKIIILAFLSVLSDLVPRCLVGFNILEDGGLGTNIGEFSEVMVYYIFYVYLCQISKKTSKI